MMEASKRFLLVSENPEDVTFLAELGQFSGNSFEVIPNPSTAIEWISKNKPSAIFLNVDAVKALHAFEFEAQKRFQLFSDHVEPRKFHFISSKSLAENRDLIRSPFFGTYLERPSAYVLECAEFYARLVKAGEDQSTHDLAHFLIPGTKIQAVKITQSAQKAEALTAMQNYFIQTKISGGLVRVMLQAAAEILESALRVSHEESKQREIAPVELVLGFDGKSLGLKITDFAGKLSRDALLNEISMNCREQRVPAPGGETSLAEVLNAGVSLIYHCEIGQKTECTILLPALNPTYNPFHFFSVKFYG